MKVTTIEHGKTVIAEIQRQYNQRKSLPNTPENIQTLERLAENKTSVESQMKALAASAGPARTTTNVIGSTGNDDAQLVKTVAERFGRGSILDIRDGRTPILQATTIYPESRTLDGDVRAKIAAASGTEAITAAGGFCAPLEVQYDIKVLGSGDRPVRDALNKFGVSRGGIEYRPSIDATDLTAGTWTAAEDASVGDGVGDDPVKDVQVFNCPPTMTAVVHGVYSILELANFTARFDPEYFRAALEASVIALARTSENGLIRDILTGSTPVTLPKRLGAARDILAGMDQAVSYFRSRRRLARTVPLTWLMPTWVKDMLRADIARQQASADTTQALAVADATIERWFSARGVNPVWHLDGLGAQAASAPVPAIPAQTFAAATPGGVLPTWPTAIDSALFQTGDWLYLDGGMLNMDMVRDSSLNKVNRFQTFTEVFEGTAFIGAESLRLIMSLEPTGEAQAPVDAAV